MVIDHQDSLCSHLTLLPRFRRFTQWASDSQSSVFHMILLTHPLHQHEVHLQVRRVRFHRSGPRVGQRPTEGSTNSYRSSRRILIPLGRRSWHSKEALEQASMAIEKEIAMMSG